MKHYLKYEIATFTLCLVCMSYILLITDSLLLAILFYLFTYVKLHNYVEQAARHDFWLEMDQIEDELTEEYKAEVRKVQLNKYESVTGHSLLEQPKDITALNSKTHSIPKGVSAQEIKEFILSKTPDKQGIYYARKRYSTKHCS